MLEMKILVLYITKDIKWRKEKVIFFSNVYRDSNIRSAISFVRVRLLSTYEYDTWEDNVLYYYFNL